MLYRNDELISKVLKHGQNILCKRLAILMPSLGLGNDQIICSRPSSIHLRTLLISTSIRKKVRNYFQLIFFRNKKAVRESGWEWCCYITSGIWWMIIRIYSLYSLVFSAYIALKFTPDILLKFLFVQHHSTLHVTTVGM